MTNVPADKRHNYLPDSGILLDKDDEQFDLTEDLKGKTVERNTQKHQRVYDPTNNALFQELLEEIKALHYTIKQIHNIEV